MMTLGGTLVQRDNTAAPDLSDIATALCRQPRFGGHTRVNWSVAEHSLLCAHLARSWYPGVIELHALLHDAHEAVTGDIPTTWKTDEMRAMQEQLDVRIYARLKLPASMQREREAVKLIDRVALGTEAFIVGPLGAYEIIGIRYSDLAVTVLNRMLVDRRRIDTESTYTRFYRYASGLISQWKSA